MGLGDLNLFGAGAFDEDQVLETIDITCRYSRSPEPLSEQQRAPALSLTSGAHRAIDLQAAAHAAREREAANAAGAQAPRPLPRIPSHRRRRASDPAAHLHPQPRPQQSSSRSDLRMTPIFPLERRVVSHPPESHEAQLSQISSGVPRSSPLRQRIAANHGHVSRHGHDHSQRRMTARDALNCLMGSSHVSTGSLFRNQRTESTNQRGNGGDQAEQGEDEDEETVTDDLEKLRHAYDEPDFEEHDGLWG